jgi:hypothetical protein
MNIDEKIQECLKRGYFNISVCYGVCNALLMEDDEVCKRRVRSDRGLEYTLRILVAEVLDDRDLIAQTENDFSLVAPPIKHCDYIRFLTNAYMTVCFVDKQVRINHHTTGMNDHRDIPGYIVRHASGKTYSEAVKKILHATPSYNIECIY